MMMILIYDIGNKNLYAYPAHKIFPPTYELTL